MPFLNANDWNSSVKSGCAQADEIFHPGAQGMRAELAGVDVVGERADFGEQLALRFDAFGQGARVVRQRMAAARFGEALDQRVGLGIEEQHAQIDRRARRSSRDPGRQLFERRAAAHVDADRDASIAVAARENR